ncbi:putative ABC transporter permease [Candidatus Saccharibacteria bacterium]|nr:putative ABC transporter permease [Candidatus Saccharibacteria bacterium]
MIRKTKAGTKRAESVSVKLFWQEYMRGEMTLEKWQWAGLLMLLVVFAGFFGWVYEYIFYYFDGGTGEFYMQGGNFLPWINIYAIGAVLIIASCWKIRKYPWAVFLLSVVVTGLLEFVGGWLVYTIGNGTRYWDYNTEIWNFGNIGGFVCLRSVLVFGFSALFLMYVVVPFIIWLSGKMSKRAFLSLAVSLFILVLADEIYNLLASKFFGWPDAMEFYRSLGWKYL